MSRSVKIALLVVAAAAVAAAIMWLPVSDWIRASVTWVRGTGALGVVVFALVFIALGVTTLPTTELYLAAGMLYGPWWGGLLMNSLGVVIELCTVLVVRTSMRGTIEKKLREHPRLAALDRALRETSLSILLLLRFSPIMPFGLLNYALAMTKVPLWKRLVANFVGMLPCTLMITYFGSFLSNVGQLSHAGPPSAWKHVAIWGGIAATLIASILAVRATKHRLQEAH